MGTNRYFYLNKPDGTQQNMPLVTISKRSTDKFITYDSNIMRLDRIAYSVYGDDTYNWLIMLANPGYFIEFDIQTGTVIRVPFPLQDVLNEYEQKVLANKDI